MKKGIQNLASALVVGFVVVSAMLGYWQVVRAGELTGDFRLNRFRLLEQEKKIARGRILDSDGIVLVQTEMKGGTGTRVYAMPSLSHVTGYHSVIFGHSNIEQAYDAYLRGDDATESVSSLIGRLIGEPRQGADVILTINSRLQSVADEALGTYSGAVVAIDPKTGAVLALASHPYFDPNRLETDWEKLKNAPGDPLFNRATQGLYVPGSTFKTVTLAAALESGVASESDRFDFKMSVDSQGRPYHLEVVDGFAFYCYNHGPTSPGRANLSLSETYAASCNIAFADLGLKLGPDRLSDFARRFGFGTAPPIEIGAAPSQLNSTPAYLTDRIGLASTAFGQGQLLSTPLQMALVAAAVADGSHIQSPHLVKEIKSSRGTISTAQPGTWREAVSPETAKTMTKMMVNSVDTGWASPAKIPGVEVAGKTGTAEIQPGDNPHAWFIGFAPANEPKIAIAVVKENAGGGGTEAAPVAKKVIEAALSLPPVN